MMDSKILLLKRSEYSKGWLQWDRVQLPPALKSIRGPLLVAFAYFLGAQAAFLVGTLSDRIFAPFWPPNVILFCTLLLVPKRKWWLYVAATFPAHLIAEATVAMPIVQSLVAFSTNCMLALLSAYGVLRFLKQPPWFGTLRNAAIYVLVTAGISPAISALGGAFVQILSGGPLSNYWTYWGNWCIANALGSVTLGPTFLMWFGPQLDRARLTLVRRVEALILAVGLVATCAIAFQVDQGTASTGFLPALLYSPFPFILWAALRFGERGASGAILVVTLVSIWQNLRASTLFVGLTPGANVFALQVFLVGIAIPVFLLGTAIDEIRRSGDATRRLAGALMQAQDQERRRIARELHDSTGQSLVMAYLIAGDVQRQAPPSCGPVIAELQNTIQGAITEVRTVSYLLHPPILEGSGLGMALESYLQGFSKRTGIHVDFELSPNFGRVSANVELVLFRVIQEGLTNIWRHSGSSRATIQLARQASNGQSQITLIIEDAGKGIPPEIRRSILSTGNDRQPTSSGLGLIGMRERLHQVGGRLEIESATGKTVIRAVVPWTEASA